MEIYKTDRFSNANTTLQYWSHSSLVEMEFYLTN